MAAGKLSAVSWVEDQAAGNEASALNRIDALLDLPQGGGAELVRRMASGVRARCRMTLNFHPDRLDRDGNTVARGLRLSGRYRPQFETGISNGGRTAVPGGDRTGWERSMFGGAYSNHQTRSRPVYGSLDLTNDPHGGSPNFGSSYLVTSPGCIDRATFCIGDSHLQPADIGSIHRFAAIAAGLLEEAASGNGLDRGMTITDLLAAIDTGGPAERPARKLEGYVEAQIHGGLSLREDVDAVVLDPSFAGTDVEADLRTAAMEYDVELRWHLGSELAADRMPTDVHGPSIPVLARRIARDDGIVDAAAIGRMAATIPFTPPKPGGDAPDSQRQRVKHLWKCLLQFGHDARPPRP